MCLIITWQRLQGIAITLRLMGQAGQAGLAERMPKDDVYGGGGQPEPAAVPIWRARVSLVAEQAECISGTDALLARPVDIVAVGAKERFALLWATKHEAASPGRACASKPLGHPGLARSLSGLGLCQTRPLLS